MILTTPVDDLEERADEVRGLVVHDLGRATRRLLDLAKDFDSGRDLVN